MKFITAEPSCKLGGFMLFNLSTKLYTAVRWRPVRGAAVSFDRAMLIRFTALLGGVQKLPNCICLVVGDVYASLPASICVIMYLVDT